MNIKPYIFTVILLLAAAAVFAHPLGNFSINQYSRLEVSKDQIKICQVLDLAEIPTFQEASIIDTDNDGTLSPAELKAYADAITAAYLDKLSLTVNGIAVAIRSTKVTAVAETGAGGLQTFKIKWDLLADTNAASETTRVSFNNENYSERLGWREIVVNRTPGIEVFNSTAFGSGATDELGSYPEQSLASPLNERAAEFSFARGSLPPDVKPLQNRDGHSTAAIQKDRLADLISVPEITPEIALFGLLLAIGLGAARDVARTRKSSRRSVSRRIEGNGETRGFSWADGNDHAYARSFRSRPDNAFRFELHFARDDYAVSRLLLGFDRALHWTDDV